MNKQHKVERAHARAVAVAALPAGTVLHVAGMRHLRPDPLARGGERMLGIVEEIVGAVEHGVGELFHSPATVAEGQSLERKGKARQKANM